MGVQNDLVFMNNEHMELPNATEVVDRALGVLSGLGVRVTQRSAGRLTLAAVPGAGGLSYRLAVRPRMTAAAAGAIDADQKPLVVAPFMPESAAEVLRGRGVPFVDAAGNAFLNGPGLRIDVRGRKPVRDSVPAVSPGFRRPFTRSGAQVTFCLLVWPSLADGPVRVLAKASGTAVGTAHAVLRDLDAAGYLVDDGSRRVLARGGELVSRWVEAYALTLSPSLDLGHYKAPDTSWWRTARGDLEAAGADLGGEAAAAELDGRLRPTTAILYTEQIPVQLLARHRCVKAPDPREANLTVRRRFWTAAEATGLDRDLHQDRDLGLAPSVLVYADLLTSGEPRQREHAQRLRTRDDRLRRLDRS
jgi:hypothetical protein